MIATMERDEIPVDQMEARIRHLHDTLDKLIVEATEDGTKLDAAYIAGIEALRGELQIAQKRLDVLRVTGNSDWHRVMEAVEEAWADLEAAFKKAAE